jgi:antitoxin VapB
VRLPAEYRFATSEVFIERQGDAVILRPKLQDWELE